MKAVSNFYWLKTPPVPSAVQVARYVVSRLNGSRGMMSFPARKKDTETDIVLLSFPPHGPSSHVHHCPRLKELLVPSRSSCLPSSALTYVHKLLEPSYLLVWPGFMLMLLFLLKYGWRHYYLYLAVCFNLFLCVLIKGMVDKMLWLLSVTFNRYYYHHLRHRSTSQP